MEKIYLAHLTNRNGERAEQTLKEHSFQAAEYAAECLKPAGLYNTGYLAGLLHDMGKARDAMDEYLEKNFAGEHLPRGTVIHTFAAVKFLLQRYYGRANDLCERLACEILASSIGMHHALFDIQAPFGDEDKNGLLYRKNMEDKKIDFRETLKNYESQVADLEMIDDYFAKAKNEIANMIRKIEAQNGETSLYCMCGYLCRLITSALMEGDRRDTAEFVEGKKFELLHADRQFWERQAECFDERLAAFSCDTPLNRVRAYISDECKKASVRKGGIYKLNVPTGGGKTLTAARFGLYHAAAYEKDRIIFITPLLSILDQNSKVLREYIVDSQYILEHHSNVIQETGNKEDDERRALLTETWDAPVIVSTLVQLLNIFFSDKLGAIRRLKSLCNSILIIDEIQSLPWKFVRLSSFFFNFLAECCGTTIVFCSATQPPFEELKWGVRFAKEPELVKLTDEQKALFKRVNLVSKVTATGMSIEELADFAQETAMEKDSMLIICNTKSEAKKLYQRLALMRDEYCDVHFLSTSLCKRHREEVLTKIGKTPGLDKKKKVICVSTQLVEAGIDFSFHCVIRIAAGLDSIAQAAGRCNRSNEWNGNCDVFVINVKQENLRYLKEIKTGQEVFRDIAAGNSADKDLLSDETVHCYYKKLYRQLEQYSDIFHNMVSVKGEKYSLVDMLSANGGGGKTILNQAFKTAGENCKVFEDNKTDVVVLYDKSAEECIANLTSEKGQRDLAYARKQIDSLKPYTVSLFDFELKQLRKDDMLDETHYQGMIILKKEAYLSDLGVSVGTYSIDGTVIF